MTLACPPTPGQGDLFLSFNGFFLLLPTSEFFDISVKKWRNSALDFQNILPVWALHQIPSRELDRGGPDPQSADHADDSTLDVLTFLQLIITGHVDDATHYFVAILNHALDTYLELIGRYKCVENKIWI